MSNWKYNVKYTGHPVVQRFVADKQLTEDEIRARYAFGKLGVEWFNAERIKDDNEAGGKCTD